MSEQVTWRLAPVLVLFLGAPASADVITTFNTGVNASGNPLAGGSADPHWSIIAGPGIPSPVPGVVLSNQQIGTYAQSPNARWIWANASGVAGTNSPYTFRLTFDLTGFNPATAILSGAWGVDNDGAILLNGTTPLGTGALTLDGGAVTDNFATFHSFQITGGFIPGVNVLDVQATDLGVIGGLNVNSLVLTATPALSPAVPEPSTLLMLAVGIVAAAGHGLRRRGQPAEQGAAADRGNHGSLRE
jgi:hypothetical protein